MTSTAGFVLGRVTRVENGEFFVTLQSNINKSVRFFSHNYNEKFVLGDCVQFKQLPPDAQFPKTIDYGTPQKVDDPEAILVIKICCPVAGDDIAEISRQYDALTTVL